MKFSQIHALMYESKLSPEQLVPYFSASNMTIRRWLKKSGSVKVPAVYERSVLDGVYRLLSDGKIHSDSEVVQKMLTDAPTLSFKAALSDLGVEDMMSENGSGDFEDRMALSLSKIGMSDDKRKEVDRSESKIHTFKKLGQEWSKRISLLWGVTSSKKFSLLDKLVAYGALFYLIFPFDLIPDQIPGIGLLDDFAILGFAVIYYLKKFPTFSREHAESTASCPAS